MQKQLEQGLVTAEAASALLSSAGSSCVQVRAMRQEIAVSGRSERTRACVPHIAPLKVGDFVRPSVLLHGGIGVTDQDDLLEITRQKASDRTGLLVLVHVTELMR